MNVIKIGGGCMNGKAVVSKITDLMCRRGTGHVFVLSAFSGITDILISGIDRALEDEEAIPGIVNRLKARHYAMAKHLIGDPELIRELRRELASLLTTVERYYFGLNFTREATPRMRDRIASCGECMSVMVMCHALKDRGCNATFILPQDAGIITDGKFQDATALMTKTAKELERTIPPLMKEDTILLIPGFFGISLSGEITTFGRGGSDYSAAVVAAALKAESLEIWKDTQGFMSVDPRLIPGAALITDLTYEEAAELAYSGAAILHPRTVEPVRRTGIPIAIKNTLDPDSRGSLIHRKAPPAPAVIKSVSHNRDISVLNVYASGVGARPGILAQITGSLSDEGINIKSVVTSQTCISLLLARDDGKWGLDVLKSLTPRPYRKIEAITDIALVSVVGQGLHRKRGLAAKCFTAVAQAGINIEMIAFGPSKAALYFLVRDAFLENSVKALHDYFFTRQET